MRLRHGRLALLSASLAAWGLPAAAKDAASAWAVAPPTVGIEGKTDGAAALSAQFGVSTAFRSFDLLPSLTYELRTNGGVGALFSAKGGSDGVTVTTPRPWAIGLNVNLRQWGSGQPPATEVVELKPVRALAFDLCQARCGAAGQTEDDARFCKERDQILGGLRAAWLGSVAADMRPKDFCEEVRQELETLERDRRPGDEAAYEAKRGQALGTCLAACAKSAKGTEGADDEPGKDPLCALRKKLPTRFPSDWMGVDRYCQAGLARVLAFIEERPRLVSHQQRLYANLGAQVGGVKFTHLGADAANPGQLVETKSSRTPWLVGGNVAWLATTWGPTWTVEGLLLHGVSYEAAEDRARYCVPAGDVTQGPGTVPATICKDLDAGGPARSQRTLLGAYVGWFDGPSYTWRASLGAEASLSGDKVRTTISAPAYLLIGGSSTYKGMLRLAPAVTLSTAHGEPPIYAIVVSLLGQRGFFSEKFDRL